MKRKDTDKGEMRSKGGMVKCTVLVNHFWDTNNSCNRLYIHLKITLKSRGNFHYYLLSCVTLILTIKIVCLCSGYYPIPLSYPQGNYNFILCTSFTVNINPISCEMTFPSD